MIPPYLDDGEPVFIKIAQRSKAPKKGNSAKDGPFYRITDSEINRHIRNGGNVGRVLVDDLVAVDVDDDLLLNELEEWPDTFVVESGGNDLGFHYYFRVPTWEMNQKELTHDGRNIGSIRSGNSYCLVPPSNHDETGNEYTVSNPRKVAEVSVNRVSDLIEKYGSTANTGGGGGGGGGVGGSSVSGVQEPIPDKYPNNDVTWGVMKSWLQQNNFLIDLHRTTQQDWSGMEFKLAKCLAEGGFSETSIKATLDRLHHNSKWHRRGENYQNLTVQKAIEAACDDPYVEFSTTDDMEVETSESRKTESGDGNRTGGGENTMPEFTERESVQVKEGSSDGDRAIEAVRVEGKDGTDSFEFVSIRKGRVKTVELTNGEEGQMIDVDETNGKSVGGTADLQLVIEALQALHEEIN